MKNLINLDKSAVKEYKELGLKCFYTEYVITNMYGEELVVREFNFSINEEELKNIDLTYKLSKFYGLAYFKLDIKVIKEINY